MINSPDDGIPELLSAPIAEHRLGILLEINERRTKRSQCEKHTSLPEICPNAEDIPEALLACLLPPLFNRDYQLIRRRATSSPVRYEAVNRDVDRSASSLSLSLVRQLLPTINFRVTLKKSADE